MTLTLVQKKRQVAAVLRKLNPLYENEPMGVHYKTPFQLLVAVILSAQSTDKHVNKVTKTFFNRLKTAQDFGKLTETEIQVLIKSIGLYRNKARSILGSARVLVQNHHAQIPKTMVELVKLPGVGRKTANVILHRLYGVKEGICVDTHVLRLAKRLGLTRHGDAIKVEKDLMALVPKKSWGGITHDLILHGRQVCVARNPKCAQCVLRHICPSSVAVSVA